MNRDADNFEESDNFLSWAEKQKQNPDFYWSKCFSALDDPAFIMSANGVILLCNRSFENFLDMSAEDIIGKKCHTLVHGTDTFTEGCPFVKSRISGRRESYILKMEGRFYRITIDPIFDRENKPAGAVHIISDIDELLRANAERAMLGKVIEESEEGVILTDLDFGITGWNRGAERMFGFKKEEVMNRNVSELLQNSAETNICETIESAIKDRENKRKDVKIRIEDGTVLDLSLGASPVYNEREVLGGYVLIISDHTKERKAERELLSFMAEAVLRLEKPLEMIKTNIRDIIGLYEKGDINKEELNDLLSIQISNAEKVLENIAGLKKAATEMGDAIPDIMKDFLRQ